MFLILILAAPALADSTVVTGAWDTYGDKTNAFLNYGAATTIKAGDYHTGLNTMPFVAWLVFDESEYTAGVDAFDSAVMWIVCSSVHVGSWHSDSDSIYAVHALKVYHAEGAENAACPQTADTTGANYNYRRCYDASGPCGCVPTADAWNTAGSWGADTDYDTSNVHPDSATFSYKGSVGYHYINVSHLVEYQLNNTNYGFRISEEVPATSGNYSNVNIISTEGASDPILVIYFTEAATGSQVIIIE